MSELKTDVHWVESVLVFQCCVKVCSLLKPVPNSTEQIQVRVST